VVPVEPPKFKSFTGLSPPSSFLAKKKRVSTTSVSNKEKNAVYEPSASIKTGPRRVTSDGTELQKSKYSTPNYVNKDISVPSAKSFTIVSPVKDMPIMNTLPSIQPPILVLTSQLPQPSINSFNHQTKAGLIDVTVDAPKQEPKEFENISPKRKMSLNPESPFESIRREEEELDEVSEPFQELHRTITPPKSSSARKSQQPMGSPLLTRTLKQQLHKHVVDSIQKRVSTPINPSSIQSAQIRDIIRGSDSPYYSEYDSGSPSELGRIRSVASYVSTPSPPQRFGSWTRSSVDGCENESNLFTAPIFKAINVIKQIVLFSLVLPMTFVGLTWLVEVAPSVQYCASHTESTPRTAFFSRLWGDVLPICIPCPLNSVCQDYRVVGCANDEDVFIVGLVHSHPMFQYFGIGSHCVHPTLLRDVAAEAEKRKGYHHSLQVCYRIHPK
jgi:hypothetical protein